ncbi:MAG TPA: hypothetical protein VK074_01340 [Fodinibius sp.]|nr:hypothetical protein [Fodinibius sp.]
MKTKRHQRALKEKILQKLMLLALPLILILGTIAACEGPTGSEGPQGPKGEQGTVGPAGEDGSVMLAGKGDPKEDVGESGDYYLNRTTGELYGPKNDKGWRTPISLKGPPGQDGKDGKDGADGKDGQDGADGKDGKDGEDGSQIYSGTGAPASVMGTTGDYYLNKANFELYGPKNPKKKNNWGTPINLKGTANVMYSSWIKPTKWEKDVTYGDHIRYFDIAANAITQDVLDKGVVNVYVDLIGGPIYQLPVVPAGDFLRFYFELTLQNLSIGYLDPDNTGTDPGAIPLDNKFRYVIIPGGVAAKSKLSTEQIKKMPYQEVKQRFGIRD